MANQHLSNYRTNNKQILNGERRQRRLRFVNLLVPINRFDPREKD